MQNLALVSLMVFTACASTKPLHPRLSRTKNFSQIQDRIFQMRPPLSTFERMGPLQALKRKDLSLNLSPTKSLKTDFYRPAHGQKAPLLIFSHGNKSFKEAHSKQAAIAATWGFYALTLQLPNRNRWLENGHTVYEVVQMLSAWPKLLDENIDTNKIILVGHSFGGSAISIAAGKGAKVSGLILLDPAIVADTVPDYLKQVAAPAILLGADPAIFHSKKRRAFFKNKPGKILEITFPGATHDDAQFPSRFALKAFGFDPFTSEANQRKFTAAIIASAFSMANYGNIDFALKTFRNEAAKKRLANVKLKR